MPDFQSQEMYYRYGGYSVFTCTREKMFTCKQQTMRRAKPHSLNTMTHANDQNPDCHLEWLKPSFLCNSAREAVYVS